MKLSGFVVAALASVVLMVGCGPQANTGAHTDAEVREMMKNKGPTGGTFKATDEDIKKHQDQFSKDSPMSKAAAAEEAAKKDKEGIDAENKGE